MKKKQIEIIQKLTRLDDIQKGGSERGLKILDLVEDLTGEVLLQQRFAVGSFLELLESSFQFLGYGSVNHFDARKNSKRNLQFLKMKIISTIRQESHHQRPFEFHSSSQVYF